MEHIEFFQHRNSGIIAVRFACACGQGKMYNQMETYSVYRYIGGPRTYVMPTREFVEQFKHIENMEDLGPFQPFRPRSV